MQYIYIYFFFFLGGGWDSLSFHHHLVWTTVGLVPIIWPLNMISPSGWMKTAVKVPYIQKSPSLWSHPKHVDLFSHENEPLPIMEPQIGRTFIEFMAILYGGTQVFFIHWSKWKKAETWKSEHGIESVLQIFSNNWRPLGPLIFILFFRPPLTINSFPEDVTSRIQSLSQCCSQYEQRICIFLWLSDELYRTPRRERWGVNNAK